MADNFRYEFIRFVVAKKVLNFGEFKTKAGRLSPYFFDAGLFFDGPSLKQLAQFYAKAILASGVDFCSAQPIKASRSSRPSRLPSPTKDAACATALTARKKKTMAKAASPSARRSRAGC